MIRKKAIAEFIRVCRDQGWHTSAILDQLEIFVTNATFESKMQEVEILEDGGVVHPV